MTTTTAQVPTTTWTSYFSYKQENSELTTCAMVGVGCKGQYCAEVRTEHRTDIRVQATSSTWESIQTGVGILECPADHIVSQIRCLGQGCSEHVLQCARVLGGTMRVSTAVESQWFPQTAGSEESLTCPDRKLLTGLNCGGTKCGQKQLLCQQFVRSESCVPSCSTLGLQCGDDGCGGSCGSCSSSESCLGNVGRCMVLGLISDWVSNDKMASTGLIASGMGCKDSYCGKVRLFFMGVRVADSSVELSGVVSDNVGKKFVWNANSDSLAADCQEGKAVTRVLCSGKHCDKAH